MRDDPNQRRDCALGFMRMPLGYELWQLDSGHWIWVETRTQRESEIHWDKWAIYRSAQKDSERMVRFPTGEEVTQGDKSDRTDHDPSDG